MRHAVAAGLVAGALLALPAIATAGAPNYDCRIAGGGRIAIDQWAAAIPLGSPIWQDPNRALRGSWMPVRTTVMRNGTQSLDGWLRQARIEPIFVNRSASN